MLIIADFASFVGSEVDQYC